MSIARPGPVPLNGSDQHQSSPAVRFLALTIGSVGVVYGDIGTSPLYAFREALVAAVASGPITEGAVLGVLSLIFWALILVVTVKYVLLLLRADNNGEGGTLSLTALAFRALGGHTRPVLILGIVGAAMFYELLFREREHTKERGVGFRIGGVGRGLLDHRANGAPEHHSRPMVHTHYH